MWVYGGVYSFIYLGDLGGRGENLEGGRLFACGVYGSVFGGDP